MNTPSHILIGAAAFAKPNSPRMTAAAMLGGLVPDLSLMLMVGWSLWVIGIPPETVFGKLYFSAAWQRVFAIDHSFLLWGGAFWAATIGKIPILRAFAGAGLLHAGVDFLVHHDDARQQLWPISTYVFHSPLSYWDRAHYGGIVSVVEAGIDVIAAVLLVRRLTSRWEKVLSTALAGLVVAPMIAMGSYHALHGRGVVDAVKAETSIGDQLEKPASR